MLYKSTLLDEASIDFATRYLIFFGGGGGGGGADVAI